MNKLNAYIAEQVLWSICKDCYYEFENLLALGSRVSFDERDVVLARIVDAIRTPELLEASLAAYTNAFETIPAFSEPETFNSFISHGYFSSESGATIENSPDLAALQARIYEVMFGEKIGEFLKAALAREAASTHEMAIQLRRYAVRESAALVMHYDDGEIIDASFIDALGDRVVALCGPNSAAAKCWKRLEDENAVVSNALKFGTHLTDPHCRNSTDDLILERLGLDQDLLVGLEKLNSVTYGLCVRAIDMHDSDTLDLSTSPDCVLTLLDALPPEKAAEVIELDTDYDDYKSSVKVFGRRRTFIDLSPSPKPTMMVGEERQVGKATITRVT